jgi:hypothetical protein
MLRYTVFSLFGPLLGLLGTGLALQPPVADNGRHVVAFVMIGFLPALVPALVAALADEALERRRGLSRYVLVALIGSAVTLGICAPFNHRVAHFSGVAALAGGLSAAFCCWLHLRLKGRSTG